MPKKPSSSDSNNSYSATRNITILLPSADSFAPISAGLSPQKQSNDYQPTLLDSDTFMSPPLQTYNRLSFVDTNIDSLLNLPPDVIDELEQIVEQPKKHLSVGPASQRIGGYVLKKLLSSNFFTKLYLAQQLLTGNHVIIKMSAGGEGVDRLKSEIHYLEQTKHPYIIPLLEVIEDDGNQVSIVMPLATGGDLCQYLQTHGLPPSCTVKRIMKQLLDAIQHCHTQGIIHRDLKLENIVIDSDIDKINLIDFGLAVKSENYQDSIVTNCGSPDYAAPEVLISKPHHGPSVDIWSIGVILFALLTGELPFIEEKASRLYAKITSAFYEWPAGLDVDPDGKDLVSKILKVFPEDRLTLQDIMDHKFMKSAPLLPQSRDTRSSSSIRQCAVIHGCTEQYVLNVVSNQSASPVFATFYLLNNNSKKTTTVKSGTYESRPRLLRDIDISLPKIQTP